MAMEQLGKHKTKYVPTRSWPVKYENDARDSPEVHWKYPEKRNQTASADKSNRSPTAEAVASYYSSTNSYKQHRHQSSTGTTHSKRVSAQDNEALRRCPQILRTDRDKRYPGNCAAIRRRGELGLDENTKYLDDELGNITEDNPEDDAGDEVEDDHEETGESIDKDYEEHEADDEIDEESDAPLQLHRIQQRVKKEAPLQCRQRIRNVERQGPNSRDVRYQQCVLNEYEKHPAMRRYYHNAANDVPEVLSEEEFLPHSAVPKGALRSSIDHRYHWTQQAEPIERHKASTHGQSSRRARTKPEVETAMEPERNTAKKCSRCGSFSNRKSTTSSRNHCRFEDGFFDVSRGPIGDEPIIREQPLYGHPNPRHNLEGVGSYDIPTSALYFPKSRRSRDVKSPIYEAPEDGQTANDISKTSARNQPKNSRDFPNALRERTRHSMHTARGPTRIPSRYAD